MSAEKEKPKEQWLAPDGSIYPNTSYGRLLFTKLNHIQENHSDHNELPRWQGAMDANTRGILRLIICDQLPEDQAVALFGQEGLATAMATHFENLSLPTKSNPNTPLERQLVDQWLTDHSVSL